VLSSVIYHSCSIISDSGLSRKKCLSSCVKRPVKLIALVWVTITNTVYFEMSSNTRIYIASQYIYPSAFLHNLCIPVCHFDTTSQVTHEIGSQSDSYARRSSEERQRHAASKALSVSIENLLLEHTEMYPR
jgi:hypothetical protein